MKVELRHVRQFLAVADTLNFSRAAEMLAIAQPALSRGIQALEHQVGVPLLTRNNREVALTPAGRAFVGPCAELARQLEYAMFRARQAHEGLVGVLRVGYTDFAIAGVLPGLLKAFRQWFPEIALELMYGPTDQQMELLEAGRLDVAFLTQPVSGNYLLRLPVQQEPLGVCVPVTHPVAGQSQAHLRALADENWVFGEPARWRQFRRHVDQLFVGAGFMPRVVQEAYNTDSIIGLVAAGMGLTVHVPNANARHREEVVFVPLVGHAPPLVTEAVWRPSTESTTLTRFVGFLRAFAAARAQTHAVPGASPPEGAGPDAGPLP